MAPSTILFADMFIWVKGLLPLAVFLLVIFYLLGEQKRKIRQAHRRAAMSGAQTEAERNRAAARPPRPVRNEEIEEFLRRAAQQRGEPGTAAGPRAAAGRGGMARAEVLPAQPAPPAASTFARKTPRAAQPPVEARRETSPRERGTLSEGVSDRLNTKQFDLRAAHLDEDMSRQDRQREQHLKKKFDVHLGTLTGGTTRTDTNAEATVVAAQQSSAVAAGVIGLLQGPMIRQAFVLSEIFHRPVDRW